MLLLQTREWLRRVKLARERRAAYILLDFLQKTYHQTRMKRTLMAYNTQIPKLQRWWRTTTRVLVARRLWLERMFDLCVKGDRAMSTCDAAVTG